MRLALMVVPEPWRSRYADEIRYAMAAGNSKWSDALDVVLWGVRLRLQRRPYRFASILAIVATLMLFYLIFAVGVIADEGDRADMMYLGVLAIGIVGALVTRFRPTGMSRVLLVMAAAQALIAAIALATGMNQLNPVLEIVVLNGFFVAMYLGASWLFRQAAQEQPPTGGPFD